MTYATGISDQMAAVRGCIQRVRDLRRHYRELAADPDAARTAVEEARLKWKAWERELGSHADTILNILDYLERPAESVPRAVEIPRRPVEQAAAPAVAAKKRRAYAG